MEGREFEMQSTVRARVWERKEEVQACLGLASNQVVDLSGPAVLSKIHKWMGPFLKKFKI